MMLCYVCLCVWWKVQAKRCTFSLPRPLYIYPRTEKFIYWHQGLVSWKAVIHGPCGGYSFGDDLSTLHLLYNLFLLLFYFRLSTLDSRYYSTSDYQAGVLSKCVLLQPHIRLLISQQAFVLLLHFSRYFLCLK